MVKAAPVLSQRTQYGLIGGFYGVLAAIGIAVSILRGDELSTVLLARPGMRAFALETGVALGVVVVLLSDGLVDRFAWTEQLRREVIEMLRPMTRRKAVCVALCSGVGEELLFRGALQPWLGLWLTSVAFGFAHIGWQREMLGWAVFAAIVGALLGGLFLVTGGLLGPIVAHAVINGIQLWRLAAESEARCD